ncbi:1,2-dihydroxy-3-keto-5-methylthiopentene dioxygenase [Coemansia aciculifera]|nr:1,2-dihydroxy-3-keto-5-methylthiopentene dioxygenase [Coemansia aciculifera]
MDSVRALGIRSDGDGGGGPQLLSGSDDGMVFLWDVERSDRRKSRRQRTAGDVVPTTMYRGHLAAVTSVAFAADHDFAYSGSLDSTIKVWSLNASNSSSGADDSGSVVEACFPVHSFVGHSDAVWDLALSPGGAELLASVAADSTCCLWSTASGGSGGSSRRHNANTPLRATLTRSGGGQTLSPPTIMPTSTCFVGSSGGGLQLAVAYVDGVIEIYDASAMASDARLLMSIKDDDNSRITRVASAEQTLVAANVNGQVRMVDTRTGMTSSVVLAYEQAGVAATAVDLSSDGHLLVTGGSNGVVKWWDRRKLQPSAIYEDAAAHTTKADEGVCDVRILSSSLVATGGSDGLARLYSSK